MSSIIPLEPPDETRERVVTALREGRLVVLPTDSVYALVADAFARSATQQMFGAKRRGRTVPLPVLIRSPRQTTGLVQEINEAAERLMASYWPGPLTLVFRAAEGLSWDIGDSRGTVSVRIPTDDLLLAVIAEVGPLAVTAANRQGEPAPTTAAEARRQLGLSAWLYVDGGERDGPRSTVVDVTRETADVLFEGAIPAAHVEQVAAGKVAWGARPDDTPTAGSDDTPTAGSDDTPTPGSATHAEGTSDER